MDTFMLGKLMELIANANDLSGGKLGFIAGPLKDLLTRLSSSNGRTRHIWLNRFKRFLRGEHLHGNMVRVPALPKELTFAEFKDILLRVDVEFGKNMFELFGGRIFAGTTKHIEVFPTRVKCEHIRIANIDEAFRLRIHHLCVPLHTILHLICLQTTGEEGILSLKHVNQFFVVCPEKSNSPVPVQDQKVSMVCLFWKVDHWVIGSISFEELQELEYLSAAGSLFFTTCNPDRVRLSDDLGPVDDDFTMDKVEG